MNPSYYPRIIREFEDLDEPPMMYAGSEYD